MIPWPNIIMVIISFCFGWLARSIQFVADRECANPEHESEKPLTGCPWCDERVTRGFLCPKHEEERKRISKETERATFGHTEREAIETLCELNQIPFEP